MNLRLSFKTAFRKQKKQIAFSSLLLVFLLLVLGLSLERLKRPVLYREKAAVATASLSFGVQDFQGINPGDPVDVSVVLTTGQAGNYQDVVAVDVLVDFPENILELVGVEPPAATEFKTYAPIYGANDCRFKLDINNPDASALSQVNQSGILEFSALTFDCAAQGGLGDLTNPVSGVVDLGWLHFQVLPSIQPGASGTISFVFTPGNTTDSNVAPCTCDQGTCTDPADPTTCTCLCPAHLGEEMIDILGDASDTVAVSIAAPTPTPTVSPVPTPSPSPTPTPSPTPSPSPSPIVTPVPSPTVTPTPTPGMANLTLKIKFQEIDQQRTDKSVGVILEQGGVEKYRFDSIGVSSDVNGIYSGTASNIVPDTYDVYIKGWAHLQKKFSDVILTVGDNVMDWTSVPLLAGDATGDNLVNIQDFGILVADYFTSDSPADFNLDGMVNIQDFRFIVQNYLVRGDE